MRLPMLSFPYGFEVTRNRRNARERPVPLYLPLLL